MLRVSRPNAFTLIEVLLALSLSTLLIGAVYWALAAGFDAHRRAERVVRSPRAVEVVLEALRADLRGAVRPGGWLAAEFVSSDDATSTDAPTHTLTFYTTAGTADQAWTAGVRQVTWTLAQSADAMAGEGLAVVRRVADNLLAPDVATVDEQVMAVEAVELTFRFHDGTAWQAGWDSLEQGDALPIAVEVTVGVLERAREHGSGAGSAAEAALPGGGVGRVYRVTRVLAVPAAGLEGEEQRGGGIRR